jgi:hypothetical protein
MTEPPDIEFSEARGNRLDTFLKRAGLARPAVIEKIGGCDYATFPKQGVSFVLNDEGLVVAVQFYGEPTDEAAEYKGSLPRGFKLNMSRAETRARFGEATTSGEEQQIPVLGRKPAWDKWTLDGTTIHAEYRFDQSSIRLLTIS